MTDKRAPSTPQRQRDALSEALLAQARILEVLAATLMDAPGSAAPDYVDAKASGLDTHTFRRAAKSGEFEVFQVGRKWVARRADIRAFIERQIVRHSASSEGDTIDDLLNQGRLRVVPALGQK